MINPRDTLQLEADDDVPTHLSRQLCADVTNNNGDHGYYHQESVPFNIPPSEYECTEDLLDFSILDRVEGNDNVSLQRSHLTTRLAERRTARLFILVSELAYPDLTPANLSIVGPRARRPCIQTFSGAGVKQQCLLRRDAGC